VADAARHGMGVVTMNPLNGGLIPQNAQRFDFIRSADDQDIVQAALRFILSNPAVTSALVGFSTLNEIGQAVAAVEAFTAISPNRRAEIKKNILEGFDGLCTGCGYCLPCPQGLKIPQLMEAYNMRILTGPEAEQITNRLKWHWNMEAKTAEDCVGCGQCETACTQHLPIIERLGEISEAGRLIAQKAE
jgi:predicted aldo/keto reductase-like oxidoreductase